MPAESLDTAERRLLFTRCLQITHDLIAHGADPDDPRMVDLYDEIGRLQTLAGAYKQAEQWFNEALTVMVQTLSPPPELMMRLQYGLARVDERRGKFKRAIQRMEQAVSIEESRESAEYRSCLLLLAGLYQRRGDNAQSLEVAGRALSLAEPGGYRIDQGVALLLMGGAYRNLGDNLRASELLQRGIAFLEDSGQHERLADAHNNYANACFELGRFDLAQLHYETSAQIKEMIGDIYGKSLIICNLAEIARLKGECEQAITQFSQALALFEQLDSPYMVGVLHMNLGATYLMSDDLVAANHNLELSAKIYQKIGANDFLSELERYKAELELRRGDLLAAHARCEAALTVALQQQARGEEGVARRLLAEIEARSGHSDSAWLELERSQLLLREVASLYELARTLTVIADLAPELGYANEGRAALAEAIETFTSIGAHRELALAQAVGERYPVC